MYEVIRPSPLTLTSIKSSELQECLAGKFLVANASLITYDVTVYLIDVFSSFPFTPEDRTVPLYISSDDVKSGRFKAKCLGTMDELLCLPDSMANIITENDINIVDAHYITEMFSILKLLNSLCSIQKYALEKKMHTFINTNGINEFISNEFTKIAIQTK